MGFQQGLTGLNAASKNLDVIGNNVANASTVGFKSSQAQFGDVFANSLTGAGGLQIGIGGKVSTVAQQFTQGNVTVTNNPLDLAINGQGFFRLSQGGSISFTRNGQFQLDKNGYVVNSGGLRLTGYLADGSGNIVATNPQDLRINTSDLPPNVTTSTLAGLNLDSRATPIAGTFNYADPTTYTSSTAIGIYDSLGNPHTYSMYFVKTAANSWNVYATSTSPTGTVSDLSAGGTTPLGTLNFNSSGAIDTATTTLPFSQSIAAGQLGTGGAALTFSVDFNGSTQYGSSFGVNSLSQDGYGSGRLSGFSIGSDGIVKGRYTNGQSRDLAQVVLANFVNPQGLAPGGDSQWTETSVSGPALVGSPGSSSLGVLQSSAVEDSNVDLTAELVSMITAQRVYQANAQTVKTQDQVLQTLVNLR